MKKFLLIMLVTAGLFNGSFAQDPEKSLTAQEAKALNGSAQPKMKDGRSYAQWVADEKAKRQSIKPASAQSVNLATANASDFKPVIKPQQAQVTGPDAGVAPEPVKVTSSSVVKTTDKQLSKEVSPEVLPLSNIGAAAKQPVPQHSQTIQGTSLENKSVSASVVSRNNASVEGDGNVAVPAKVVKVKPAEAKPEAANPAFKGTSMDKAAPVSSSNQESSSPALPTQHSGNTAPAKTEEKPVSKQ